MKIINKQFMVIKMGKLILAVALIAAPSLALAQLDASLKPVAGSPVLEGEKESVEEVGKWSVFAGLNTGTGAFDTPIDKLHHKYRTTIQAGALYQHSQYLAFRAYGSVKELTNEGETSVNDLTSRVDVDATILSISAMPTLPINEKFSVYADFGLHYVSVNSVSVITDTLGYDKTKTIIEGEGVGMGLSVGIGAVYDINKRFYLTGQYTHLAMDSIVMAYVDNNLSSSNADLSGVVDYGDVSVGYRF